MALHHSTYMAVHTGGKSKLDVVKVKRLAAFTSAIKAFVVESTKEIRNAFMGIATAMKEKQ